MLTLRELLLIMLLSFVVFHANAQKEVDSLRMLLPQSTGNARVDVLNNLASYVISIDTSEAREMLVESLSLSEKAEYDEGKVKAMLVMATYFSKRNELVKVDSILELSMQLAREINDQKGIALGQLTLGILRVRQGRYAEAIENHFQGIEAARELKNADLEMSHMINIGAIKQRVGELDEASKYWSEALEIGERNNFELRNGEVYINLAVLEYQKQNLGLSIQYNEQALEIFRRHDEKFLIAKALNNLGFAHNILGELDKAMTYYDQSMELRKELGDRLGIGRILLNQAQMMKDNSQPQRAMSLANESLKISTGFDNKRMMLQTFIFLYSFHEERGEYARALGNYKHYSAIKDSIALIANEDKIKELTSQFEFSRLEGENKLQQSENEMQDLKIQQSNQIILIISVFFLLAVLWFVKNRNALRNKLKLSQKDQVIAMKDAELRINESEAETQRLIQYTDHLLLKNEVLEEKRLQLSEKNPQSIEEKNEIDQLVQSLKNSILNENDWAAFRLYFDAVYSGFFQKLEAKKGVDLTLSEQRLASLMKMKLATKEIARILAISPDSVLKSKTRLRQKLNFENTKSLDDFLNGL